LLLTSRGWRFGDENNQRNDVEHSTFNAHLTGTDGTTVGVHDNTRQR
jgi:hypothetical protein